MVEDIFRSKAARCTRDFFALYGGTRRAEYSASVADRGGGAERSYRARDSLEFPLLRMFPAGDDYRPVEVSEIVVDGTASRRPPENRQSRIRARFAPGILISAYHDAG